MKLPVPIIPATLPTYHIMTTYIQYLFYLYDELPDTTPLLSELELDELHHEFHGVLVSIVKSTKDQLGWSTQSADDLMPIEEIEGLVRVYKADIIPFSVFRRSWESRSSRIAEILSSI